MSDYKNQRLQHIMKSPACIIILHSFLQLSSLTLFCSLVWVNLHMPIISGEVFGAVALAWPLPVDPATPLYCLRLLDVGWLLLWNCRRDFMYSMMLSQKEKGLIKVPVSFKTSCTSLLFKKYLQCNFMPAHS